MSGANLLKKIYDAWLYMYGVPKIWHVDIYKDGRVGTLTFRFAEDDDIVRSVYGWHATELWYVHELSPNGENRDGYLWDDIEKKWRPDRAEEFIHEVFHARGISYADGR